ncbi:hypothetical protein D6D25_04925 [Aureobasidium pullulans]|nr:hypothetical protein D6D25_04925 [Aureobasidium pullulans]
MGVFQWMVSLGLGKHLWDVPLESYSPSFLRAWLTVAVLYSACMLTMKLSVLMLYRRLFPIQNFRIQWWDVSVSEHKCINRTALYIAYTVMNSISTWWILLMPMPIIWSLALKNDLEQLDKEREGCFEGFDVVVEQFRQAAAGMREGGPKRSGAAAIDLTG